MVVGDQNSPGGGIRLTYSRDICGAAAECVCQANTPVGPGAEHATCRTDCGCAWGLSCLGFYGFAGLAHVCARSCDDLRDCGEGQACDGLVADGLSHACATVVSACQTTSDCPEGFACLPQGSALRCVESTLLADGGRVHLRRRLPPRAALHPGVRRDSNLRGLVQARRRVPRVEPGCQLLRGAHLPALVLRPQSEGRHGRQRPPACS